MSKIWILLLCIFAFFLSIGFIYDAVNGFPADNTVEPGSSTNVGSYNAPTTMPSSTWNGIQTDVCQLAAQGDGPQAIVALVEHQGITYSQLNTLEQNINEWYNNCAQ